MKQAASFEYQQHQGSSSTCKVRMKVNLNVKVLTALKIYLGIWRQ